MSPSPALGQPLLPQGVRERQSRGCFPFLRVIPGSAACSVIAVETLVLGGSARKRWELFWGERSAASGCDRSFRRALSNWEQRLQEVCAGSGSEGGEEKLKRNGREEPPARWETGGGVGALVLLRGKK